MRIFTFEILSISGWGQKALAPAAAGLPDGTFYTDDGLTAPLYTDDAKTQPLVTKD